MSAPSTFDVLVVGGGINGAGIARDFAGRGASVLLCEKDDLAQHTSSSSTKLIHGGLRYLEYYEFSLVRKALAEREVLLKSAPHIIRPLRFVMPHDPGMRPVWMIRAGLFLYDHLARREVLAGSRTVRLAEHPAGAPLKPGYTRGFVYSDGWVDDARLVVLNAIDAAERGATILTRWRCVDARRGADRWEVRLQSAAGEERHVTARALVNAAGPWAGQFLSEHAHAPAPTSLRLVKGSHIVVPKLFDHDHAYIFQNPDRRIIFAIPYEGDFTLIGTTDVEHHGAVGEARIDASETAYLCEQASRYFVHPVSPSDVVWSYSGVRPLLDDDSGDPSAVTRDYQLDVDTSGAPLLSVWGGKITTFRKLAEEAVDLLAAPLALKRGAWTRRAALPGGDLGPWIGAAKRPDTDFARFEQALALRHPELAGALCHRLARAYGSRVGTLLDNDGKRTLGAEVAPGLFEAELHYLHRHEWARSADDVLWRRSKLGLHLSAAQRDAVALWCTTHWTDPLAPAASAAARTTENAWN
jgi:glycerol-3-phosphate dehydrogenase